MFELVGIDPQDGNVLWRQMLRREAADNVTFTPIWDAARRQVLISHGTNEGKQKVSMTTPVFMEREADDRQGQMGFVMPKKVSEQGIPEPTNKSVLIQQRVGGRFAVIRFAGRTNDESMRTAEQKLRSWMDVKGLVPDGDAEVAGYDPPWTPGPLRRNEILIRCK